MGDREKKRHRQRENRKLFEKFKSFLDLATSGDRRSRSRENREKPRGRLDRSRSPLNRRSPLGSSPRDRRSLSTSSSSLTSRSRSGTPEDNPQSPRFDKFSRGCPPAEQHSPQVSATGSQPGDLRAPPDPVQVITGLTTDHSSDFRGFPDDDDDELLGDNIKSVLGENPTRRPPPGNTFHKSVVDRWDHLLKNGLPHEEFLRLREEYPFPPNFMAMSPPEINPELLPVLSQTHKGRDGSLLGFQRQVGTAAVAIGTVLGSIISNPSVTGSDILKPIWDAGKSLMALQYDISRARRRRICDSLDGALKRATKDVPPTSWLFGDDLRGKLREVEGISSFSQGLLQLKRGTPREKPIQQPPQQRQHQRPQNRSPSGTGSESLADKAHSYQDCKLLPRELTKHDYSAKTRILHTVSDRCYNPINKNTNERSTLLCFVSMDPKYPACNLVHGMPIFCNNEAARGFIGMYTKAMDLSSVICEDRLPEQQTGVFVGLDQFIDFFRDRLWINEAEVFMVRQESVTMKFKLLEREKTLSRCRTLEEQECLLNEDKPK
ncbi:hypothetical protein GE061_007802 [Apolygus lucorum]|uniref:Uncharacterized protein n=1 Tax=Apolygus lucorum TaxID=248454 RepID=A0A8S9WQH1_APOLU|nr:hypothetical protein GE061_007802 [Apolygus lucorum]